MSFGIKVPYRCGVALIAGGRAGPLPNLADPLEQAGKQRRGQKKG
jgi:hypothetical protein